MTDLSKRLAGLSPQKKALLRLLEREQRAARSPGDSTVVEIQPRGSKPPFFCVHPSGGNVLCYAALAHSLGADYPFYGIQTPGLDGEAELYTSVEQMAEHYLGAMRALAPEGPYFLGGYSMGALVAFEMARQLSARRETVGLLALIDMWVVKGENLPEIDDAATLIGILSESLPTTLENLRQLTPPEQLSFALQHAISAKLLPPNMGIDEARRIVEVYKNNDRAAQRYVPRPYAGRITLFRAADERLRFEGQRPETDDPTWGWNDLAAGGVEIQVVPGHHYNLIEPPQVQKLAERLRHSLDAAHALPNRGGTGRPSSPAGEAPDGGPL